MVVSVTNQVRLTNPWKPSVYHPPTVSPTTSNQVYQVIRHTSLCSAHRLFGACCLLDKIHLDLDKKRTALIKWNFGVRKAKYSPSRQVREQAREGGGNEDHFANNQW